MVGNMRRFCSARIWRRADEEAFTEGGALSGMGVVRPLRRMVSWGDLKSRRRGLQRANLPGQSRSCLLEAAVLLYALVAELRLQKVDTRRFARARRVKVAIAILGFGVKGSGFSHHERREAGCMVEAQKDGSVYLKMVSAQPAQRLC